MLAQTADTIQLKDVTIQTSRIESYAAGSKTEKIDSIIIAQYATSNLADLLSQQSSVFIKSYGGGGLATTSFRGGSAAQTAVLWNSFNINSPMNGQSDLALIPISLNDKIILQYGGQCATNGSGAVSGIIHLHSTPSFNKGIEVNIGSSIASFSNYNFQTSLSVSKKKWASTLKSFYHDAKNDYPIVNPYQTDHLTYRQSNAHLLQSGIILENAFRINAHQKFTCAFWWQNNIRQIPPSLLQLSSNAQQDDQTLRLTGQWEYTLNNFSYFLRVAYFNELLHYDNGITPTESHNKANITMAEMETKFKLPFRIVGNSGLQITSAEAGSEGYNAHPIQTKAALFAAFHSTTLNRKLFVSLSGRQEWVNNTGASVHQSLAPFTYSLGSDYTPFNYLRFKAQVSKVYRIPTLNDLFWNPGGNIALLPEQGISEEIGFRLDIPFLNKRMKLSIAPTWFNRNMNNWILWLPSGNGFWTPTNVMKVWSRGMESKSELSLQIQQTILKIQVGTNYVVSTNEQAISYNDASVGRQLIYVPMYSGFGNLSCEWKGFYFLYNQHYTGYRFTSTDNKEYISPYWISGFTLSKRFNCKNKLLALRFTIDNLFNASYQLLLNRPMPMRNYSIGLQFQFNKPNQF